MFCREWLAQLELHRAELEAAGLKVAAVGLGEVEDAAKTCGRLAPTIGCFTRADLNAHEMYQLKLSSLGSLPGTLAAAPRALARGHIQGRATTDARGTRMLGGVFVIDRAGVIRYADYNEFAGNHPPFAEIVAAAKNLS